MKRLREVPLSPESGSRDLLDFYGRLVLADPEGGSGSALPQPPKNPLRAAAAKKLLLQRQQDLVRLHAELKAARDRLVLPTAAEYEEIANGQAPLPLAGHLAALLDLVVFHLEQAIEEIKDHGYHTEGSLQQDGPPSGVLLGALARVIRERSRP